MAFAFRHNAERKVSKLLIDNVLCFRSLGVELDVCRVLVEPDELSKEMDDSLSGSW